VLDDPAADHDRVTRLVLCQGKVYYDLAGHEDRERADTVAIARIEQLYPFPTEQAAALLRSYPNLREVLWVQEEPQNMARGGRSGIVSKRRARRRAAALCRPSVACEPERGLSDRAPARAGPNRARSTRAVGCSAPANCPAHRRCECG